MRALLLTVAAGALALAACDQADNTAADMDAAPAAEMAEEAPAEDTAAAEPPTEEPASAPVYAAPANAPAHIQRAVASAERTPAMTERDLNRKPAEILMLAGVSEGDHVVEFAGFGQYFTTLLAEAVGPEGQVDVYDLPYTDRFAGEPSRAFAAAHDNVDYYQGEYDEMALPEDVDAALIVLYYHDLHVSTNTVDIAAFNQKVFDSLKPGGTYLVIDHNAEAGSGTSRTDELHRIDPQVILDEVQGAGFVLAQESDILAHPDDSRTAGIRDMPGRDMTDQSVFVFQKPE